MKKELKKYTLVEYLGEEHREYDSIEECKNLIEILKKHDLLEVLDPKLKEVVEYREKYPESSMAELAEIISSETERPITKSCINHRFRKIKEMLK